jgi:serine/threonine protein kinase
MSTVFVGRHSTLGYSVAIKVLHPALSGDDGFIERFEREARIASSLQSNNVVRVIDFGEQDGAYYIVMDFIEGDDLAGVMRKIRQSGEGLATFPVEITFLLLEEVAKGLRKAHTANIIHRDIKPSNILLSVDGEVKIADFGLARNFTKFPRGLTLAGSVVGTPSYMSPEQAAGEETIDYRTDIFSLGVMAYEFLAGEKPFQGRTVTEVQQAIINTPHSPLSLERCSWWTPEIGRLVDSMLAKDPAKRPQCMDKVLTGLCDCLESVDPTRRVFRLRQNLLAGFARDPVKLSAELHRENVKSHLNRGLQYMSMGREKYSDAEREFICVLALDATNAAAAQALDELREHGGRQDRHAPIVDRNTGTTQSMPVPPDDRAAGIDGGPPAAPRVEPGAHATCVIPAAPVAPPKSARRPGWRVGVIGGIGVIALLLFRLRPSPDVMQGGATALPAAAASKTPGPGATTNDDTASGQGAMDRAGHEVGESYSSQPPEPLRPPAEGSPAAPARGSPQSRAGAGTGDRANARAQTSEPPTSGRAPTARPAADAITPASPRTGSTASGNAGPATQDALSSPRAPTDLLRGLQIAPLTTQERDRRRIPPAVKGVIVTALDAASPLAAAGLQAGDVIMRMGRHSVIDQGSLTQAARLANEGDGALILDYWDVYRRCESRKTIERATFGP